MNPASCKGPRASADGEDEASVGGGVGTEGMTDVEEKKRKENERRQSDDILS